MHTVGAVVDTLMRNLMPCIKEAALSKPFTAERSRIVDEIDYISDRMREGMTFAEAMEQMRDPGRGLT